MKKFLIPLGFFLGLVIFLAVGLISVLLFASPTIGLLVKPPSGEQFSEFYLLGPHHMLENYPYNIGVGQNYSMYVGVVNNLGSTAYYTVYLKFRNQTDPLPNAAYGTPSALEPIYEYQFCLSNGERWEVPLMFSVWEASTNSNKSTVNQLLINGLVFNVNKSAAWDANNSGFPYGLVYELWVYNTTISAVQFHNRYVSLRLNLAE